MKIPKRLNKYKHQLAALNDKRFRKVILRDSPNEFIKTISEICKNSLHGNIPHSVKDKKCLKKHKSVIKSIIRRSLPLKKKRELLLQSGGFLVPLLKPIIGSFFSLFKGI